jgi:spermidine dehydrogenase
MIIQMIRMPNPLLGKGKPADLFRAGRADLLGTSFDTFETHIRKQLTEMYGSLGFDAERDIAAITVNRWSHGYVYGHNDSEGKPAYQAASKAHGRITIANVDAAGETYFNFGIDTAWRAVQELKHS